VELVERHQVNLDRPVNDYLHAARVTSPMWNVSKATVRRVANHTASLTTYDCDCLVSDRDCDASAAAAIRRYGAIVWPPGDRFDYLNLDYGNLGEVIAEASHEPGRGFRAKGICAAGNEGLLSRRERGSPELGRRSI